MKPIDTAIHNALIVNMGYTSGEEVAIVAQEWGSLLGDDAIEPMVKPKTLVTKMRDVLRTGGIDVKFIDYVPKEAGHGVDAPREVYDRIGKPAIVFMPTAFSLTHTNFRKFLTENGARVASMPTFTLEMFEEGGPMSVDYDQVHQATERVAEQLKSGRYVKVTGRDTDIVVEIDPNLVAVSSGLMTKPGDYGNLPGAEAYVVPVHDGDSNGRITVPEGWGGSNPLKHTTTFHIEKGRFVDVQGATREAQTWLDNVIKPTLLSRLNSNFDVLAELGIGTNPNITAAYIHEHGWSPLTAEKISGSAHFANGNSKAMGGQNDVPIHVDWVVPDVNIEFNYQP